MNLKTKVKSYSFWVSLASALILILKLVGQKFGFAVDEGLISDLFTSLCAILVIMGIIVVPNPSSLESKVDGTAKTLKESSQCEVVITENVAKQQAWDAAEIETAEGLLCDVAGLEVEIVTQENEFACQNEPVEMVNQTIEVANETSLEETSQPVSEEVNQNIISDEQPKQEAYENSIRDEFILADPFDMSAKLESFIDKVCTKRGELSTNIAAFAEFLQNELDSVKNRNN